MIYLCMLHKCIYNIYGLFALYGIIVYVLIHNQKAVEEISISEFLNYYNNQYQLHIYKSSIVK